MKRYHSVKVKFEPRDLWMGVYWDRKALQSGRYKRLDIYVCLIPCLPLHLRLTSVAQAIPSR